MTVLGKCIAALTAVPGWRLDVIKAFALFVLVWNLICVFLLLDPGR